MFTAEKGSGCLAQRPPVGGLSRRELGTALIATGIPFMGRPGHEEFLERIAEGDERVGGRAPLGAAALDLPCRRGSLRRLLERGLSSWDVAAGAVILREAGGQVSDLDGGDNFFGERHILASNNALHAPLMKSCRLNS